MNIMGHRLRFYAEKLVAFEQICSKGNALTSFWFDKIKNVGLYFGILGGSEVTSQFFGFSILGHIPKWLLFAWPAIEISKDFFLGLLDKNKLHLWQIRTEWERRKGLDTYAKEQMEMLRELHAKQCPDSKVKHSGFVSETEEEYRKQIRQKSKNENHTIGPEHF